MVDIVNTDPNLANPHLNGPPDIYDLLYDYFVKQQFPGAVGPFGETLDHEDQQQQKLSKKQNSKKQH